jgi:hypothetical protein
VKSNNWNSGCLDRVLAIIEHQNRAGVLKPLGGNTHALAARRTNAQQALELDGRLEAGVAGRTTERNESRHGSSPNQGESGARRELDDYSYLPSRDLTSFNLFANQRKPRITRMTRMGEYHHTTNLIRVIRGF